MIWIETHVDEETETETKFVCWRTVSGKEGSTGLSNLTKVHWKGMVQPTLKYRFENDGDTD